jgi:hypothetical protein
VAIQLCLLDICIKIEMNYSWRRGSITEDFVKGRVARRGFPGHLPPLTIGSVATSHTRYGIFSEVIMFLIRDFVIWICIRIRTSGLRILLFSSVAFKMFFIILSVGKFISVFKGKKLSKSHKTVDNKVFKSFFASWWKDTDLHK